MNLSDILNEQVNKLEAFTYKNELRTMQHVLSMPLETLNLTKNWLKRRLSVETLHSSKESSQNLRIRGNEALKLKKQLTAADYYTKAIIAANDRHEELSLAHANRAQALLEFGYYSQAYDDCVCALNYGYSENLRHKLFFRQATCAAKLNNAQLMKLHIEQLRKVPLNQENKRSFENLQQQYNAILSTSTKTNRSEKLNIENKVGIKRSFGRCLKANASIEQNQLVFCDTSYSAVTISAQKCCHNCLITLYIPFPCTLCSGNVNYCSLDCYEKDSFIHKYECAGYRLHLFKEIGIGHLALRTILKGAPELITILKPCTSVDEIWSSIFNCKKEQTSYMETIYLKNNFSQNNIENIKYYALLSYSILLYLVEITDFFKELCVEMMSDIDSWQIVVSALFLRHVGQFIINGHTVTTLQPTLTTETAKYDYLLFESEFWNSPNHLKKGYLHKFSSFGVTAAANFPFLSMANHSCNPSFQTIFNCRSVSALATKRITSDEEVFNCYTLNYKISSKMHRAAALEEHNFVCQCEICTLPEPDYNYERLYTFICEFCSASFVPSTNQFSTIFEPYHDIKNLEFENILSQPLKCSKCQKTQNLEWYKKFLQLLMNINSPNFLKELSKLYARLNYYLPKYNNLHITLGFLVIEQSFDVLLSNRLNDYQLLGNIIENYLDKIALKSGHFSLEYASQMTYLWDFMATCKHYRCNTEVINHTLNSTNLLSNEFQIIFKNYFQDNISH